MSNLWNELAPEIRERIELADAIMAALKRGETIERWLNVGRGLLDMQTEAMRIGGSNINKGKSYIAAWQALAAHAPHLKDIEQSTRSHAVWLAENWEQVNGWLLTLAVNKRLTLNHPRAIHRSYDLAHTPPGADAEWESAERKSKAQQSDLLEIIHMLLGQGVVTPSTSISGVADALEAALSFDLLRRLHRELGRRVATRAAAEARRSNSAR
jgi:hypothetical protein